MQFRFDDGVADAFARACSTAAEVLQSVGWGRSDAVSDAMVDFSGGYAKRFEVAAWTEARDRRQLIRSLYDLSDEVHAAKRAAVAERERIAAHARWQAAEEARVEAERALLVGAQPFAVLVPPQREPDATPARPPSISATFSAEPRVRYAVGGTRGTTSAVPEALRHFATRSRWMTAQMRDELHRVQSTASAFMSSCSWVSLSIASLLQGYAELVDENANDERWMEAVAAAFDRAGTGMLIDLELTVRALASQPAQLQKLLLGGDAAPDEVAALWRALLACPGFDAEAMLQKYAYHLGSLDGMPALARVTANRHRATAMLPAAKSKLAALDGDDEAADLLRSQIAYLERVEKGEVQLYLYEPHGSRIIEMFGTPSADTVRTITYVPGTFTSMHSFYRGDVQEIADELTGSDGVPGTVVFVYKDGLFPGENQTDGSQNLTRIGEANDFELGRESGRQLASFEAGMRVDPDLRGTGHYAFGHSWGLANVTSAEVAGAHYDGVLSLAGAWMLPEWEPGDDTWYYDLSYDDILMRAQREGYVGGGNYPRSNRWFMSLPYYEGYGGSDPGFNELFANHNRVATADPENVDALKDIKWLMEAAG